MKSSQRDLIYPALIILLFVVTANTYHANIFKFCIIEVIVILFSIPLIKERITLSTNVTLFLFLCITTSISLYLCLDNRYWQPLKMVRHIQFLLIIPFIYSLILQIKKSTSLAPILLWSILACSILNCLTQAVLQVKAAILGENVNSANLFFINLRQESHLILPCTIFLTWYLISKQQLKKITIVCIYTSLSMHWFCLLAAAGRASITWALLILLYILIITIFSRQFKSIKAIYALFPLATALAISFFLWEHMPRLQQMVYKRVPTSESFTTKSIDSFTSGRTHIWKNAFELLQQNYLFGMGPDAYNFNKNSYGYHAHSIIFQHLAEWGLVGCVLFLILIIKQLALRDLLQFHKLNTIQAGCFLAIISLLLLSLTSGVFYSGLSVFVCCIFFAVYLSTKQLTAVKPVVGRN